MLSVYVISMMPRVMNELNKPLECCSEQWYAALQYYKYIHFIEIAIGY